MIRSHSWFGLRMARLSHFVAATTRSSTTRGRRCAQKLCQRPRRQSAT
ncbi:MAG: hypothetical protein ACK55Z_31185 [bacterium]